MGMSTTVKMPVFSFLTDIVRNRQLLEPSNIINIKIG